MFASRRFYAEDYVFTDPNNLPLISEHLPPTSMSAAAHLRQRVAELLRTAGHTLDYKVDMYIHRQERVLAATETIQPWSVRRR